MGPPNQRDPGLGRSGAENPGPQVRYCTGIAAEHSPTGTPGGTVPRPGGILLSSLLSSRRPAFSVRLPHLGGSASCRSPRLPGESDGDAIYEAALETAIRRTLKQAAIEEGQWNEKRNSRSAWAFEADMQKRAQASPDDGDALALTFAQPVSPAEVEEEDEEEEFGGYGGHSSSGGWMR
jgi:hypothetical protein